MQHTVLLFYKYVDIKNPTRLMVEQKELCHILKLKGRMIIAHEGINATLEGTTPNIVAYVEELKNDPRFEDVHFKKSEGTGESFPKLSVKVRPEIVSAHLKNSDLNPNNITGKYLKPDELHEMFQGNEEFYIVDMRNGYEQKSGYFRGSINSEFNNFRDLPTIKEKLKSLKDKKIVTVCTGGIRCEKASGYLVNEGFDDVYQLQGGIHSYMEKFPGEDWLGKLYVFDKRILIDFTKGPDKQHEVVGKCEICNNSTENYIDCARPECHKHQLVCKECIKKFGGKTFCSEECQRISNLSQHQSS
jgi:UPF0176 protein